MGSSCNVCVEKKILYEQQYSVSFGWFESEIFAKGLRNSVRI